MWLINASSSSTAIILHLAQLPLNSLPLQSFRPQLLVPKSPRLSEPLAEHQNPKTSLTLSGATGATAVSRVLCQITAGCLYSRVCDCCLPPIQNTIAVPTGPPSLHAAPPRSPPPSWIPQPLVQPQPLLLFQISLLSPGSPCCPSLPAAPPSWIPLLSCSPSLLDPLPACSLVPAGFIAVD